MKLGIHFIDFSLPGEPGTLASALGDTAKAAEAAGCSKFTVMDHWFQMEFFATALDPMLEAYTSLGYLAGLTDSMELATLVTGVTYRHPGLLAKIVTTLDVLSRGRAQLGIGAAWYEREHLGLGVPYPPTSERFERLEETIQIVLQMWSDDDGPFNGRHYQLAETICRPRPVSAPRPRIMIGGNGENKTLRLVAKYADVSNIIPGSVQEARHKFEVIERHCAELGRDPEEIERTVLASFLDVSDKDAFVATCAELAALGVQLVEIRAMNDQPAQFVDEFASYVVPRLAQL
jgi:F420-dependent oxidoreductase-like protein